MNMNGKRRLSGFQGYKNHVDETFGVLVMSENILIVPNEQNADTYSIFTDLITGLFC